MIDWRSTIVDSSASMLAAVRTGPLTAEVPGCPGWTVAQLAIHMGFVQRWATQIVTSGVRPQGDDVPTQPEDPSQAADYLAAGTAPLIAALDSADVEAPCWNFTGVQQDVSFWKRRQALEVAVHCWDAEAAIGRERAIAGTIAADAIDELLRLIAKRVIAREKLDTSKFGGDVHLHCTDVEGEWTFEAGEGGLVVADGHRKAAAAIRANASDLLLYLYGRVPVERVERFGDLDLIDAWRSVLRF